MRKFQLGIIKKMYVQDDASVCVLRDFIGTFEIEFPQDVGAKRTKFCSQSSAIKQAKIAASNNVRVLFRAGAAGTCVRLAAHHVLVMRWKL